MDVAIEQLKVGNRDAWNQAYPILYAICISVCCSTTSAFNHQEQEDIAVEAVTQIIEYVERVDSFEECKKLAVTITKNRLKDRFRQLAAVKHGAGKVDSLELHEGLDPQDTNQPTPSAILETAETALMVVEALKQVPEQYGRVVAGIHLKGLTQQEVADLYGLKIGSIGVYLDRGMKALSAVLKQKSHFL